MNLNLFGKINKRCSRQRKEVEFIKITYELCTKDVPTIVIAYGKSKKRIDIVKIIQGENGEYTINLSELE